MVALLYFKMSVAFSINALEWSNLVELASKT